MKKYTILDVQNMGTSNNPKSLIFGKIWDLGRNIISTSFANCNSNM